MLYEIVINDIVVSLLLINEKLSDTIDRIVSSSEDEAIV